jgi:hypothetical protein
MTDMQSSINQESETEYEPSGFGQIHGFSGCLQHLQDILSPGEEEPFILPPQFPPNQITLPRALRP